MEMYEEKIQRRTLTIDEAAKELGICKAAAYDAARTGELPTIRVGKRWLVPIVAFNKMLEGKAA